MEQEQYIRRCFDLARLGAGNVSPNPMVGAVLVYENRIIGEGYHQKYGTGHAEVNAINSVEKENLSLISKSTLYVSLEPCCIFGKTPPCTNFIIKNNIPKVVISCLDQTPGVSGNGVKILQDAGIEVITNVLQKEGEWLSRFRNTFAKRNRPRIILKYAQSRNGFIGKVGEQVWISNNYSKRWVHQLRSEVDAILIGTNTAIIDDPQLNNRLYFRKSPIRIILDKDLRLPKNLKIFDNQVPTWIINEHKTNNKPINLNYIQLKFDGNILHNLIESLATQKIISLVVEGGANTLNHFIQQDLWDEAYVLIGNMEIYEGIKSPDISGHIIDEILMSDTLLRIYENRSA